jgi:hypothetical protein
MIIYQTITLQSTKNDLKAALDAQEKHNEVIQILLKENLKYQNEQKL